MKLITLKFRLIHVQSLILSLFLSLFLSIFFLFLPDKRRLTLLLSCAMKFQSYPHDTQYCNIQVESREYFNVILSFITLIWIAFSLCDVCLVDQTQWEFSCTFLSFLDICMTDTCLFKMVYMRGFRHISRDKRESFIFYENIPSMFSFHFYHGIRLESLTR